MDISSSVDLRPARLLRFYRECFLVRFCKTFEGYKVQMIHLKKKQEEEAVPENEFNAANGIVDQLTVCTNYFSKHYAQ